jgi:TctA family transporter
MWADGTSHVAFAVAAVRVSGTFVPYAEAVTEGTMVESEQGSDVEHGSDWNWYGPAMMVVSSGLGVTIGVIVSGGSGIGAVFGAGLCLLAAMHTWPMQRKPDSH